MGRRQRLRGGREARPLFHHPTSTAHTAVPSGAGWPGPSRPLAGSFSFLASWPSLPLRACSMCSRYHSTSALFCQRWSRVIIRLVIIHQPGWVKMRGVDDSIDARSFWFFAVDLIPTWSSVDSNMAAICIQTVQSAQDICMRWTGHLTGLPGGYQSSDCTSSTHKHYSLSYLRHHVDEVRSRTR